VLIIKLKKTLFSLGKLRFYSILLNRITYGSLS